MASLDAGPEADPYLQYILSLHTASARSAVLGCGAPGVFHCQLVLVFDVNNIPATGAYCTQPSTLSAISTTAKPGWEAEGDGSCLYAMSK